jgi:hypothetical protein
MLAIARLTGRSPPPWSSSPSNSPAEARRRRSRNAVCAVCSSDQATCQPSRAIAFPGSDRPVRQRGTIGFDGEQSCAATAWRDCIRPTGKRAPGSRRDPCSALEPAARVGADGGARTVPFSDTAGHVPRCCQRHSRYLTADGRPAAERAVAGRRSSASWARSTSRQSSSPTGPGYAPQPSRRVSVLEPTVNVS